MELDGLLQGVLLEVLNGKDLFNAGVEKKVVHFGCVVRYRELFFKNFEFLVGEVDLLSIENSSELLLSYSSLSKEIVILEEFSKSDSIFLNLGL